MRVRNLAATAVAISALIAAPLATAATHPTPHPARGLSVNPKAPYSGKHVPGVVLGTAAARQAPTYVSQHFMTLNGDRHGHPQPAQPAAVRPNLGSWSGAQHDVWGTGSTQTAYGAQAFQSINPSIVLPASDPDTVYSPTLDPSALTCIEMTTVYYAGSDSVKAWDWCNTNPNFYASINVDSTFENTYVSPGTTNGAHVYGVRDIQTDPTTNSWTSYLYNFTTNAWDTFYTSANTSKLSGSGGGWDMFEVYTNYNSTTQEGYYCTDANGSVWTSALLSYQTGSGGPWIAASAGTANPPDPTQPMTFGGCDNPTLARQTYTDNEWRVSDLG